jgi:hypothetical protein
LYLLSKTFELLIEKFSELNELVFPFLLNIIEKIDNETILLNLKDSIEKVENQEQKKILMDKIFIH